MTSWTSGDIQANGIRLHYHRTGGDKPPLVAAHGITDNGLCWTPLAEALAAEYDVIMIDARGHGESDAPTSGYDLALHAADHAAAIRALGLRQPAMIGHSMGAVTAALVAARNPDLLNSILLEDPPWRENQIPRSAKSRPFDAEAWRQQVIARKPLTIEQLVAEGRQQNPTWSEGELGPWALAKQQVSPQVLDLVKDEHVGRYDHISQLGCPLLLLTGDVERGAIVTPSLGRAVGALNARAQVVHIAGAGHSIRREQFEAYLGTVRRFLRAIYR